MMGSCGFSHSLYFLMYLYWKSAFSCPGNQKEGSTSWVCNFEGWACRFTSEIPTANCSTWTLVNETSDSANLVVNTTEGQYLELRSCDSPPGLLSPTFPHPGRLTLSFKYLGWNYTVCAHALNDKGEKYKLIQCVDAPGNQWKEKTYQTQFKIGDRIMFEASPVDNSTEDRYIALDNLAADVTWCKEDLKEKQEKIKDKLTVPKRKTVNYQMQKKSAVDDRGSSQAIGALLGIGILVVITALVLLPDIPKLIHDLKYGATGQRVKKKRRED